MAKSVHLLFIYAPVRCHAPWRVIFTVVIGLCSHFMLLPLARAEDAGPPLTHPIWTLVPTHIDRDKETHVRIEPKADVTDALTISVDRPIRIGPDGTFMVNGKPMQIFGMIVPDRQELCETPGGARWACGVRAHAAFTALLATSILICDRVSPLGTTITIVRCKAGSDDIAERMISEGWAEADDDASVKLKSLEAAARKALRGRWGVTVPEF